MPKTQIWFHLNSGFEEYILGAYSSVRGRYGGWSQNTSSDTVICQQQIPVPWPFSLHGSGVVRNLGFGLTSYLLGRIQTWLPFLRSSS